MKKLYSLLILSCLCFSGYAQTAASYSFSAFTATYTSISTTGTSVGTPFIYCDDCVDLSIAIGFTFVYCGTSYTTLSACTNGRISLANSAANNWTNDLGDLAAISGGVGVIMPYWEDLEGFASIPSNAYYQISGTAPNRIFTFEWYNFGTYAGCTASCPGNFQVKLYEGTNIIDFCYGASAYTGRTATIGIANSTTDYQTLPNVGASPTPSSATFTTTLNPSPATDQVYRWYTQCTGTPTAGTTIATKTTGCAAYADTLSLLGTTTATGLTYQWESSTDGVTWTPVAGATNNTYITTVTATIYYECIVTCSFSTSSSTSTPIELFLYTPPVAITGPSVVCVSSAITLSDATSGGTWSSSATGIATVGSSSGVVTGVSASTATISYTLPTGCSATKIVTVVSAPAIITGSLNVCTGTTSSLSDAIPGGTWSSSNTTIATIGSTGTVFGITPGTTIITYSLGSCSTTTTVTVSISPPAVTGPSGVCAGFTIPLTDSVTGGTWGSSLTGVATVTPSTGIVTGVAGGATVITYTAPGGCYATKAITVHPLPGFISGASSVCIGACTPLFDGGGGTWSSSNVTIATVGSSTGTACGVSAGTAIITYTLPTGCWTTTSLVVSPLPSVITGAMVVCPGSATTLSDSTLGGFWTSGNTTIATVIAGTGVVTGAAIGTVTISYTEGCTATTMVTVEAPPPFISGVASMCAGATTTLTDIPGGTWSSSDTTVAVIGLTTGIVTGATVTSTSVATITFTSSSGCTTTQTITVYPLPPPITGTMHVCVGQTTILNDGVAGGTWASANTGIATVISPGVGSSLGIVGGVSVGTDTISYSLTYTIGTSCATYAIVTVNPAPAPVGGTPVVCVGATTTLTDIGSGTWTSGSPGIATVGLTTGIVTGVAPGVSTITYSAGGACVVTIVVTVNPLPPLFTVTGGGSFCAGGTGVPIGISGSTAGISYQLYVSGSPIGPALTGTGGPLTFGLQTTAGTYTVIATNTTTGCSRSMTGSLLVTINPLPAPVTGDSSICSGTTATLSDLTPGGTWSSSASGTAGIGSVTGIVTGGTAGTATITYKITATGCLATDVVTVNPLPALFTVTGGGGYCAGATGVHIGLSGSAVGFKYQLFSGGIAVSALLTGTGGALDFGVYTAAGIYTATATNSTTGCTRTMTGSVTVTINPIPVISGSAAVCVGANITLTASPAGGTWASSNTADATVGASSGIVTGLTTGTTVIITYTSLAGCAATTTVNVSPSPGPVTGPATVCVGSSVTETDAVTGGLWTSSSMATATVGSLSGTVTGAGTVPNTTVITYSLGTGCIVTRTMTVTPAPGVISGPGVVCSGATITLTDPTAGGTWSSSATGIATVNLTSGVVLGETAGVATITYTLGGCIAITTVTVNFAPTAISGSGTVCAASTITLTDGITGGTWTSSNTAIAPISSTGDVSGANPGGRDTITYSLGGTCVATKIITVNPISPISGATGICAGSATTLTEAAACGTWSSSNPGNASVGSASGIVTGVISGTSTVITFTSCAGCTATTTVNVSPSPGPITGPVSVCVGAAITEGDAVTGGLWTSGNTGVATVGSLSGIVTGVNPGPTVITYSLGGTCTRTATVNVIPLPVVTVSTAHVCLGATVTIASATPAGGAWSSSNTGIATVNSASGAVTGLSPGLDTITYISPSGCSRSIAITINPLPSPITGTTSLCEGAATELSDGVTGGTWSSSNSAIASVGSSSGVVTGGTVSGPVNITYTIGTGCSVHVTATVIAPPPAITGAASVCAGLAATLSDATTGGTWSSENIAIATVGSGSGIVSGITSGTAIISYTVGTGCTVIAEIIVNPVSPVTGDSVVCAGQSITLTDTTEDGVWTSSAPAIASAVTATATTGTVSGISITGGTAVITYTLPTGCAATRTVTVNPAPPAITGVTHVCAGSTTTLSDTAPFGTWSSDNTTIAIVSSGGVVTGETAGTTMISYTLAGTGCPAIVPVIVNALPDPIGGPTAVCVGSTVMLTDAGGGAWSCTPAAIATISAAGIVSGVSSGTAFITYTLPTSCTATMAIDVDSLPSAITGTFAVCAGYTATLSDLTGGGTWSSSNTAAATVDPVLGVVYGGITPGLVTTISYATASGCAATAVVTVDALPGAIMGAASICQGATTILTDASGGGVWTSSDTTIAAINAITGHLLGTGPGNAIITYTIGSGCSVTTSIFVNPAPSAIIGSPAICIGTTVTLADTTAGGTWTSSNTAVAPVDGIGDVSGFALGTSAISYMAAGCPAILNVTVNPLPASITGPIQVCAGSAIILGDAVPGGSWSSDNTSVATINTATGVVTGLTPGVANMTYSLGAGCTTAVAITVNGLPDPITGTTEICKGSSSALFDGTTGGTWSSGNTAIATVFPTAGAVTGVAAGTTGITYTLSTGCEMATTVTVNPAPSAIIGSPNVCLGSPRTLTDSVAGGAWSSSNTAIAIVDPASGVVTGMALGTATIDYVIGACTVTRVVTVDPLPTVFTVTGDSSYCEGGIGVPVELSGSVTGVNYILYRGATATGTFAGTGSPLDFGLQTVAGSYTVMAISTVTTCSNFMSGSALVTIMPSVPPSVSISAVPGDTVCAGTSTTFTPIPVYGGGSPTYQWSVNDVNVSTSTTYTFIPANGDIVEVAMASNGLCAMPAVVTHAITMTVNPFERPGISIGLTPGDTVCQGGSVTLTPIPAYGGSAPIYTWIRNGADEGTGPTYSYIPANGDSLRCLMVSNYLCPLGGDTASSVEVIMNVDTIQLPIVSISASPGTSIGNGEYDTLRAVVTNGGVFPTYQWYVNGYPVAGATTNTYISNSFELTREDSVSCMVTSDAVCPATSHQWVFINASNVGVKTVSGLAGDVVVIPNPNNGAFTIRGTLNSTLDEEVSLELTDMLGQVVYSSKVIAQNGKINEHVHLSATLANGMYMLSLHSDSDNKVFHIVIEQ